MQAWFRFILRNRVGVVLLVLLLSGVAAASLSQATVSSTFRKIFFGDHPAFERYRALSREFGNDASYIVGWEDPQPLSDASLRRLDAAVTVVQEQPVVDAVHSLLTAPLIRARAGGLDVQSYGDAAADTPPDQLLAELRADELAGGLFVSADGRATAAVVELAPEDLRGEDGPRLNRDVTAAFVAAGHDPDRLHTAGFPPTMAEVVRQSYLNLSRVLPASMILLLLTVYLLFRRMLPVLVTGGVASISVLWTLGFATALDPELSIFMTVTPAVILIVAFADVIHLYSAYLTELRAGRPRDEAILESAADVGTACLFTSVTTFVGFLSLSFVPTPVFRVVGVVLGFGVAVALLLAMTLTPIILSWLPTPDVSARADGAVGRALDAVLHLLRRLATERPRAVVAGWMVVIAASLLGVSRIEVETDMMARLPADNPVRVDAAWFEQHFQGTSSFELYVFTPQAGDALDPDLLARIDRAQQDIAASPEVDSVVSLVDLLGRVHRVLGGAGRLPDTREGVAQELLLFELSGGDTLDRVIDFDRRTLHLSARMPGTGFREVHLAARSAEQLLRDALGPEHAAAGVRVEATGMASLLGWWLDNILLGQKTGFAFSFVVIGVIMVGALRSVRAGLWSMLPNMLPLLVLGGWVGLAWDKVDSDTFVIAMLAIGIGVDDTIHFLVRYRLERQRADGLDPTGIALRRSFAFAGRAIVMTSLILVVGFLPFATTGYFSTRIFGTLLPGVLVVALLADLLLVPAMARLGWLGAPGDAARREAGRAAE